MPKRDPEIEATEAEPTEAEAPTVGQRLRAAREKKKLTLEDLAAQTRIPQRHLESIENSDWDALPAPTYSTGFAKSYAGLVGLDRMEIGDQLRAEMGGQRFTANPSETFEPADPRRTMPKWLVIGTVAAVIVLIALMSWLNQRSLEQPDEATNVAAPVAQAPVQAAPQPVADRAQALRRQPDLFGSRLRETLGLDGRQAGQQPDGRHPLADQRSGGGRALDRRRTALPSAARPPRASARGQAAAH